MAYYSRYGSGGSSFGGLVPWAIKRLLIVNTALFVLYYLATAFQISPLLGLFHALGLIPSWVIRGALWQPFTYQFLHSPHGFTHVLFNMLMLWMFGANLERDWGSRKFLEFYFFCGIGAGLCDVAARLLWGNPDIPTIGASGAIYGVLLAFGLLYPNTTVYFSMIFPIPAKYFVMILGGMSFLMTLGASGDNVAHVAHLGGMLFGWIYLRRRPEFLNIDWIASYRKWKLRRAQRRFQVYMKKRDRNGGGWVN